MRSRFGKIVLIILLATLSLVAKDRTRGDFEINLWASPYHFGKPPLGEVFAQTQQGVGLRYYFFVVPEEVELFVDVNRFKSNIFGPSTTFRFGEQLEFRKLGRFGVVHGINLEILRYRNESTGKTHMPISIYPTLGLRYGRTSMTVGYIFPSPSGTKHYPAMVSAHFSFCF